MEHVLESAAVMTGSLVAIVNPLAGIPVFLGVSDAADRSRDAVRVTLMVLTVLVFSLLFGRFALHLFGISLGALSIAGGLLVAASGWQLVRATDPAPTVEPAGEAALFSPLVLPVLAGPGAIGTIIAHATRANDPLDYAGYAVAIGLVCVVVLVVLLGAQRFASRLSPRAMVTMNQVLGLIVLTIGAEMVLHGAIEQGLEYGKFH